MTSYIVLDIQLSAIKNFLDHVLQESGKEIEQVVRQYEEGNFDELDDYYNALFYSASRQEIAIRAVLYEITGLVEHELQSSAHQAWLLSEKHKGPKSLVELPESSARGIRSLKMVSDLKFPEVQTLIEQYYQIKIDELPGAKLLLQIREIVNAFKHRKGLKDFRKLNSPQVTFPEFYKPEVETAYDAIEQAQIFIKALWKATNRESTPISKLREMWILENDFDNG
jgi:hypothetical protein